MHDKELFGKIRAAVAEGDAEQARALARQALESGLDPLRVLEEGYTRALQEVGARWETGEVYLPEMILAAEAMKSAMRILQPKIRELHPGSRAERRCVLGTVRGDIHDIGKSIVGSLLEASGFEIIDLGTNVDPVRFVSALRDSHAGFMGLSALLTTTMPEMKTIIDACSQAGLRSQVRIAVGGAPVTQQFADEIGADGYAEDGLGAMRLFQRLAGEKPAMQERASTGGEA
jgi:corrinoid protein of di/trimethylamine methyltransferase